MEEPILRHSTPLTGTVMNAYRLMMLCTVIFSYFSVIFSMSIFANLVQSYVSRENSMVLCTCTRSVKIMRNMLCRTDLRMSFKGITSSINIRAWAVQQSHVSLPAFIQQLELQRSQIDISQIWIILKCIMIFISLLNSITNADIWNQIARAKYIYIYIYIYKPF